MWVLRSPSSYYRPSYLPAMRQRRLWLPQAFSHPRQSPGLACPLMTMSSTHRLQNKKPVPHLPLLHRHHEQSLLLFRTFKMGYVQTSQRANGFPQLPGLVPSLWLQSLRTRWKHRSPHLESLKQQLRPSPSLEPRNPPLSLCQTVPTERNLRLFQLSTRSKANLLRSWILQWTRSTAMSSSKAKQKWMLMKNSLVSSLTIYRHVAHRPC